MNPALHNDLLPRLLSDFKFKEQKDYLRQGECPACHKKELYAHRKSPWILRCGRLNKCGAEIHVKELYPELFNSWSERHPATPANPNAAADAYLRDGRGFDLGKIGGWYSQEHYWHRETDQGSATVRFNISHDVWWERIIDRPDRFGSRKATFRGDYGGMWWQPPTGFDAAEEIWIVEGIFDAIALYHHGIAAVATLACTNYPTGALQGVAEQCEANQVKRPKLVWAFDGDQAGRRWMRKFCERARENGWDASVAVIPHHGQAKLDWNDMHQRGRLEAKHIEDYRYNGSLLMVDSPTDKALLIYKRHGWATFHFDFDNRLWWWNLNLDKLTKVTQDIEVGSDLSREEIRDEALLQAAAVTEICNCLPTPLYYLKNEVTDDAWYYFRIDFPHDGVSVKNTFTAGQLAATAEFKKRLLHSGAGAIWSGNAGQLDRLLSKWTYNIKTVQTIDYTGYSIDHGCYVFNQVAVKDGRLVEINEEDYFELGKLAIKSLSGSLKLDIDPDLKHYSTAWFDKFYLCFGPKGVLSLAFWMGSLFAEQIRSRFESFPFLEIVGEPGAGKTTLIETMWKLLGRNGYEGFDPMKGSNVGFMRSMAQVSNLPVVLIEADRETEADGSKGRPRNAFHWDSLKSLYNGGSLRTTGVKNGGNDTYEPQFRAALVISQNAPVQASTPIMERIIHLSFDKSRQSEEGREAALELGRMPCRDVSGFLVKAVKAETEVLDLIEQRQREFEKRLEGVGVKNQRIQKNYAQLMALVFALAKVCPITESQRTEALKLLADLALERERDLARDHPIVERFWEAFDYINAAGDGSDEDGECVARLNHSRDPAMIAVNLNHFIQEAADMRQQIPDLHDLKRLLKTSRARKFIDSNVVVSSAINARYNRNKSAFQAARPTTLRCWLFKS